MDDQERCIAIGVFRGTVEIPTVNGIVVLVAQGPSDIVLTQTSSDGEILYCKAIGGTGGEFSGDVHVDANNKIYVTGSFSGTTDMDPGPGVAAASTTSNAMLFVARYANDGSFETGFALEGEAAARGNAIATDPLGNIWVGGNYSGTIDLDPGPTTVEYTYENSTDALVAKYSPGGELLWGHCMGGEIGVLGDRITDLKVDNSGGVHFAGFFSGSMDIDPGPEELVVTTENDNPDVFFGCYTADGALNYGYSFGSTGHDGESGVYLALGPNNEHYLAGKYYGTVDFNPGPSVHNMTCPGYGGSFLAKYDGQGNFIFVKGLADDGSTSSSSATSVTMSGDRLIVAGWYAGTLCNFGNVNQTSAGRDSYICIYTPSGVFLSAAFITGMDGQDINSIESTTTGTLIIGGSFESTADFSPGWDVVEHDVVGETDAYLTQWHFDPGVNALGEVVKDTEIGIFPNPAEDIVYLNVPEGWFPLTEIKVVDVNGRCIIDDPHLVTARSGIELSGIAAGIYALHLRVGVALHQVRFVKQ